MPNYDDFRVFAAYYRQAKANAAMHDWDAARISIEKAIQECPLEDFLPILAEQHQRYSQLATETSWTRFWGSLGFRRAVR